jgi:ParB-like chromosome segregation protein Spo0J
MTLNDTVTPALPLIAGLDSAASGAWPIEVGSPVVDFRVPMLRPGVSPRSKQLFERHVAVLVEVGGGWPPIVVRRSDFTIIDGHHRVEAAGRLGMATIPGTLFDGSDDDAYIEAVHRNVQHGLVLSMAERKISAAQILGRHGDWSDRRVAAICGLSRSTVGGVRRTAVAPRAGRPSVEGGPLDRRLGQDGRRRPVDPGAARDRILEVVRGDPSASLRAVARAVGASPETVRSVRDRLRSPSSVRPASMATAMAEIPAAFDSTSAGQTFFAWFARTSVGADDCAAHGPGVPLSRVYEVADEARRRATRWREFADYVEGRVR